MQKHNILKIIAPLLLCASMVAPTAAYSATFKADNVCEVYFSPKGGATQAIVNHIDRAQREIQILAFYFTSKPITHAVENARKRGVNVRAVLDRSQPTARGNRVKELQDSGVEVRIDGTHPIMHNKVIIIDMTTVVTGSFNFSATAESRNAENLLICSNKDQAALYRENWDYLWGIARDPKDAPPPLKRSKS